MRKILESLKDSNGDGFYQDRRRRFLARCEACGRWQEVSPNVHRVEVYFEVWEGDFCCCGRSQVAIFPLEKDYLDFH